MDLYKSHGRDGDLSNFVFLLDGRPGTLVNSLSLRWQRVVFFALAYVGGELAMLRLLRHRYRG